MKKKSTHGGARKGAGRKPAKNPKEPIFIYPDKVWVDELGKERTREVAEKAIEKEYKKLSK